MLRWSMIFSENRFPPSDQVRGQAFSGSCSIEGRVMKSLFIDCNDQLAPVWQRVVRADDPAIDVNCAALAPAELPKLLQGYDICIDDHSYLPTALVEQCDG